MANVKVSGTWRTLELPYARISGTWKPCKQVYAKVGGVWKIAFDLTEADTFSTSGSLTGASTPGYVPWEVLSGTWTKASGNVSADATNRVAAVETGMENIEVEIDTTSTTDGGPGVAFWIQDQSNWWGVRFYTEQYSFVAPVSGQYNYFCNAQNITRNASTFNPANYVSCTYSGSGGRSVYNGGRLNTITGRTCACPTVNTCAFGGLFAGGTNCSTSCTTTNFANSTCTNNTKGTFYRVSSCGGAGSCGTCPVTSCPVCPNFSGTTPTCPTTTYNFTASFGVCSCFCTTNFANTPNFNTASYNCPQTVNSTFTYTSFSNVSGNSPSIPNCTFAANNVSGNYMASSCIAQVTPYTYFTTVFAIYKRGQLVRSVSGTTNIISNQDFGDVGNLYAKTYGNSIDFRQYSSSGKAGTASNVVTYAAGSVTKGTKHGILVTAVPYTQSYNIGRFKVTA